MLYDHNEDERVICFYCGNECVDGFDFSWHELCEVPKLLREITQNEFENVEVEVVCCKACHEFEAAVLADIDRLLVVS